MRAAVFCKGRANAGACASLPDISDKKSNIFNLLPNGIRSFSNTLKGPLVTILSPFGKFYFSRASSETILINEPGLIGTIRTHSCTYGDQEPYSVAVLNVSDSPIAEGIALLGAAAFDAR